MEDPRSALDNQRLNVTKRKRGTLHALVWENGHRRMPQRPKKVTLCSRIPLVKQAEGAYHQRSTETLGERRTVIADPQPAFPFDRNNYLIVCQGGPREPFSCRPSPCFATVSREPRIRQSGLAGSNGHHQQNGRFDHTHRALT